MRGHPERDRHPGCGTLKARIRERECVLAERVTLYGMREIGVRAATWSRWRRGSRLRTHEAPRTPA